MSSLLDSRRSPSGDFVSVTPITVPDTLCATITTTTATVAVAGVVVGQTYLLAGPKEAAGIPTGLLIGQAHVSAADVISVDFVNPTAGGIQSLVRTFDLVRVR